MRTKSTVLQWTSDSDTTHKSKWRAKIIDGEARRIEIRKSLGKANLLVTVKPDNSVESSANYKTRMSSVQWVQFLLAVEEAKERLRITQP